MKRKKILILLLSGCLLLTACSGNPISDRAQTESEQQTDRNIGEGEGSNENKSTSPENPGDLDNSMTEEENAGNTNTDQNGEGNDFQVSVEIKDMYEERLSDSGDSLLYMNYATPVVTMNKYKESEKKINDFFVNETDKFLASGEDCYNQALEEYRNLTEEEKEYFGGYGAYLSYDKLRMDENILSFNSYSSIYTGGAHDIYGNSGYNFDTRTGEELKLADLFEDEQAALSDIRQFILKLCENPYYKVRLFNDYEDSIDSVISDRFWTFNDDGMHFISNPYVLASYAEGEFEFIIPYSELIGLKEEYSYCDNEMYPFLINETIHKDLDGDGTQESITMSMDSDILEDLYMGNWDDMNDPKLHLAIGESDYSDVIKSSMDYLSYNFSPYCYVVDLDTAKPGLEIMFTDIYENDYCMTYFYEYRDGNVNYLGSIPDRPGYDSFGINGDGTISSRLRLDLLQTASSHVVYKLENGKLTMVTQDWYEVDDSYWDDSYKTHSILQDVTVYTKPDLSSETKVLTPDDGKVSFPATDNEHWYMLKTEEGETYYLYLEDNLNVPVNGEDMNAMDIFENLLLAG